MFIVAQYKCGTSWLLSALSAHPALVGLREIDIIRAAYRQHGRAVEPADSDHRLGHFFGKSAWSREDVVPKLEQGDHPNPGPLRAGRPQGFDDLEPAAAVALYERIRDAGSPAAALDAFLAAAVSRVEAPSVSHVVFKAADQIAVLDQLLEWQPEAKKVAITRDGRDAAISAGHFKRLMQDAPWFSGDADYQRLLESWAGRAALIADRAAAGDIEVIRYEDLSADFAGTLGPLLQWLGVDASPEVTAEIDSRTSFEARTGRKRGSEGTGVIRKGAVGEWRHALNDDEKALSWELAGEELDALGYPELGEIRPLPPELARLAPSG